MKHLNIVVALVAIVFGLASAPARATNCEQEPWHDHCKSTPAPKTPPPAPAQPVNATGTGTGYGGQGFGGYADADAAAKAWASLDAKQRAELNASLSSDQRQALMNAISNLNVNKNYNWSGGGAASVDMSGAQLGGGQGGGGGTANSNSEVTGNKTTIGGTNYQSKSYALSLAFTIPGHNPAPASMAAPQVGVVTSGTCIPVFDEQGKVRRSTIDYESGTTIEVPLGKGESKLLTNIVREEVIHGVMTLAGFGADTKAEAKSESGAGGFLSLFASGGKSDSGAVGTTGFKEGQVKCVYRTNYYQGATTSPVTSQSTPAAKTSDIYTIREEVSVPGRRGGVVANIPPSFCKENPDKCREVKGSAGKRTFRERTMDCASPANPDEAKLCAERTSRLGQPPVMKEEVVK